MIVYYDSTGKILSMVEATIISIVPPANAGTPLYLDDTTYADVWVHPGRYLIISGVPVEQPYITTSYASGTLTVTLNAPPTTPPTSATVTLGASTQTVALTSNTGTLALLVHPSVAAYSLPVQVTATGCVGHTVEVGTPGQTAPVGLQIYTPSGGSATVGPVGASSKAFLRAWAMGLTAETQVAILTEALQDLMTATAPVAHILVTKVIPALQAANLLTGDNALTAQEQAALATWQNDFAPTLTTLADTTDASGTPTVQLAEAIAAAPQFAASAQAYATACGQISGLA